MISTVRKELDEAFATIEKSGNLAGGLDNVYSSHGRTSGTSAVPPAQAELTTT